MDAGLKVAALAASALLGGCASLSYYTHLARGQIELLNARESIARIVGDESRDPELRRRLASVLDARRYAIEHLHLPDNGSYTRYAQLDRPYVLWNVLATPEFSLTPLQSCFPISGCVAYRGFYDRDRAERHAQSLRAQGHDVEVGGVPAYSTLGWFDDPVLSSMMHWSDAVLIGTLFHELAHQQLYVQDDTAFNESFARFVEEEGLRQYLGARSLDDAEARTQRQRESQFRELALDTRARLEAIYRQPLSTDAMRAAKAAEFDRLRTDFAALRDREWDGARDYDAWFARPLNNASLLPFGLYDEWVPAFAVLYQEAGSDWRAFYTASAALGARPIDERRRLMRELREQASNIGNTTTTNEKRQRQSLIAAAFFDEPRCAISSPAC